MASHFDTVIEFIRAATCFALALANGRCAHCGAPLSRDVIASEAEDIRWALEHGHGVPGRAPYCEACEAGAHAQECEALAYAEAGGASERACELWSDRVFGE